MVFGITRVRDEDDIVDCSLRRILGQVDRVIIGEGNSSDRTREILDGFAATDDRVTVLDDTAKNFKQREVMTAYARLAREMGGTWGVFFDMDEAWYADGGRIADVLPELPDQVLVATARNLTHSATSEDDVADPDIMGRMGWRSIEMLPLMKVACRLLDGLEVGHGNHSASFEGIRHLPTVNELLEVRHFPYRTPEQLIKRVRIAYPMLKASGLPRFHGQHMWEMGEHWEEYGDDGLRRWFANGMFFEDPASNPNLVHDPVSPLVPTCP